jgi:hypothetical protein
MDEQLNTTQLLQQANVIAGDPSRSATRSSVQRTIPRSHECELPGHCGTYMSAIEEAVTALSKSSRNAAAERP